MMISTPCLFRADASPRMGIGHVMRCLALAQAVHAEKGRAVFLSHCESQSIHRRVETAGIRFLPLGERHPHPADLSTTLALLRELQAAWLVLDGYNFDPGYQQAIRGAGHRLLVIDDMAHFPEYHADLLLNQNINAGQLRYACGPDTTLLLGPRYALLRPEFLTWRGWRREIPRMARNLLVTMGGGDPDNVTLRIVRVLHRVRGIELEAKVVVGPASPHTEELRQAVDGTDGRLHLLANVTDMPALMAWADVALAAGGSTCWELAFMGVPSMAIVLADNQRALAEELGRRGVVVNLGWHEKVTPTQITQAVTRLMADGSSRIEMACRGRELVDGEGTDRVLMRLCGERFRLRRVCEADGRLLWEWANDPTVRRVSFSPEPIPWAQHVNWLKARLEDPNCFFWIAVNEGEMPIGQARIELNEHEAVISIGLDAKCRGKGYGSTIIERAAKKLYQVSGAKLIHAYVKPDNEASLRAFSKAGFQRAGITQIRGQSAVDFALRREEMT